MIPYAGAMVCFAIALISYFKGYMLECLLLSVIGGLNLHQYFRLRKAQ